MPYLILSRRPGESIVLDGGRIVIKFLSHRDPKHQSPISIGISAPADVPVMRQELLGLKAEKPLPCQWNHPDYGKGATEP